MNDILSHFSRLRAHGENRWSAVCPAHDDKSPSLALALTPDGRWLVHCFAGCDTAAVLTAAGVTFADLMPESLSQRLAGVRRAFSDAQLLRIIAHESLCVALYACDRAANKPETEEDRQEMFSAYQKIHAALEYAHDHFE